MATLLELFNLRDDTGLKNRIAAAMAIRCQAILEGGSATANQKAFSTRVFSSPEAEATVCLRYLLAKFNASTVAQIQGATDAALQAEVNVYVNTFAA